jgi:hypothetical protein
MPRANALAVSLEQAEEPGNLTTRIALVLLAVWVMLSLTPGKAGAQTSEPKGQKGKEHMENSAAADRLLVVWTSGDREVAEKMVFMYCKNAKLRSWWPRVRLVVWGPSARLLAQDQELQKELEDLQAAGVELQACKACADLYGVADKLKALGIEVLYIGGPFTEMLKSGWTCLTF